MRPVFRVNSTYGFATLVHMHALAHSSIPATSAEAMDATHHGINRSSDDNPSSVGINDDTVTVLQTPSTSLVVPDVVVQSLSLPGDPRVLVFGANEIDSILEPASPGSVDGSSWHSKSVAMDAIEQNFSLDSLDF